MGAKDEHAAAADRILAFRSGKMRFSLVVFVVVLSKSCERPFGHFSCRAPHLARFSPPLPSFRTDGGVKGIRTNPQKIGLGRERKRRSRRTIRRGAAAAESPVFVIMAEPATSGGTIRRFLRGFLLSFIRRKCEGRCHFQFLTESLKLLM